MELLFLFILLTAFLGLIFKVDDDSPWAVLWTLSLSGALVLAMWYISTDVVLEEASIETGYVVESNEKVQFFTDRYGEQVLLEPIYDESDSLVVEIEYPRPFSLETYTYEVRRP